jgi:hypothetical protein
MLEPRPPRPGRREAAPGPPFRCRTPLEAPGRISGSGTGRCEPRPVGSVRTGAISSCRAGVVARWHRRNRRPRWRWKSSSPLGRPRPSLEKSELIAAASRHDAPVVGERVHGGLSKVGIAARTRSNRRHRWHGPRAPSVKHPGGRPVHCPGADVPDTPKAALHSCAAGGTSCMSTSPPTRPLRGAGGTCRGPPREQEAKCLFATEVGPMAQASASGRESSG